MPKLPFPVPKPFENLSFEKAKNFVAWTIVGIALIAVFCIGIALLYMMGKEMSWWIPVIFLGLFAIAWALETIS